MSGGRTVTLVGRPNVGKSRLFNRLVGRRVSIVHDMPGVTRDSVGADVGEDYYLMDTGGIGMDVDMTPQKIAAAAEEQVEFAVQTASVVVVVVDGRAGCTALDERVAGQLRRFGKKTVLAVNKIDNAGDEDECEDFSVLGLGDPVYISAEHGRGIESLQAAIQTHLGPRSSETPPPKERRIRISLVGRPNVGKSSIGNRLLNSSRLIVSDVPGTTRDTIETDLDYAHRDGQTLKFRLCDTAGLRARSKVDSPVEFFSSVRTESSLEQSDVVFVVVDAIEGVTRQDQMLVGKVLDAGRGVVIVVNKWDLVRERFQEEKPDGFRNIREFERKYETSLRKELFFLPDAPVLFVSAETGFQIEQMLETAASLDATLDLKLPTGRLNRALIDLIEARAPKMVSTRRFKVFYTVQTGNRPFRIRLYCNRATKLERTYKRYLENGLIREFQLKGCPIRFDLFGKDQRYADPEEGAEPPPKASLQRTKRSRGAKTPKRGRK